MAKRTFFLTSSVDANGWCALSETAQSAATTASGWTVSTGATNHSELAAGVERAASTFTGTTPPDGTLDTTLKDALRTPDALTLNFAPGEWQFNFGLIAVTNGGAQDGRIRFRVIKADADGANATEVTSGQQQASLITDLNTSELVSSLTFELPRIELSNQYLFFQLAWERTGAGGMTNADALLRTGTASTGTRIVSSEIESPAGSYTGAQIPGGPYLQETGTLQAQIPGGPYVNETVAGGGGAQDLQPALYSDADTFHAPTVAPGAVDLAPALYADADTFHSPTVGQGGATQELTPALYSDADSFHAPTVTPGAVNLAPALFADGDTFHSPVVSTGAGQLFPDLYVDADTFFSATVTPGSVTLAPSLYADADTFPSATVSQGGAPQELTAALYSDADAFHSASVTATYGLAPALYADADSFHSATVAAGAVTLAPALFADGDVFYSPVVVPAGGVVADLFEDADTFYGPTVGHATYGFGARGRIGGSPARASGDGIGRTAARPSSDGIGRTKA